MVVAAFNQEKALVGAFSVITNLRMDLFEALEQDIFDCLVANWDSKDSFSEAEELPFYIELYRALVNGSEFVGLDLRLHYIEFMTARFRITNLHHCGNPFQDISPKCDPRCVRVNKTDKVCFEATVDRLVMLVVTADGQPSLPEL